VHTRARVRDKPKEQNEILREQNKMLREQSKILREQNKILREQNKILREQNKTCARDKPKIEMYKIPKSKCKGDLDLRS